MPRLRSAGKLHDLSPVGIKGDIKSVKERTTVRNNKNSESKQFSKTVLCDESNIGHSAPFTGSSSEDELTDIDNTSSDSDDDLDTVASKACEKAQLIKNDHRTKANATLFNKKKDVNPNSHVENDELFYIDKGHLKVSSDDKSRTSVSSYCAIWHTSDLCAKGQGTSMQHKIAQGSEYEHSKVVEGDKKESSDSDSDFDFPVKTDQKATLQDEYRLSTSLEHNVNTSGLYVDADAYKTNKSASKLQRVIQKSSETELMRKSVVTSDFEKRNSIPPYQETINQLRKQRKKERDSTKGKGWYHLPAPEMTEEKKNDLMVLQMRKVLDPKHFYKNPDLKVLPKYFQMGTVVESAADFYNSRIPKKQRKATLVDELLADAEFRKYNKRKYAELQESQTKARGAHRHMKRLKKKKK